MNKQTDRTNKAGQKNNLTKAVELMLENMMKRDYYRICKENKWDADAQENLKVLGDIISLVQSKPGFDDLHDSVKADAEMSAFYNMICGTPFEVLYTMYTKGRKYTAENAVEESRRYVCELLLEHQYYMQKMELCFKAGQMADICQNRSSDDAEEWWKKNADPEYSRTPEADHLKDVVSGR